MNSAEVKLRSFLRVLKELCEEYQAEISGCSCTQVEMDGDAYIGLRVGDGAAEVYFAGHKINE